jgi:hypothetical protein
MTANIADLKIVALVPRSLAPIHAASHATLLCFKPHVTRDSAFHVARQYAADHSLNVLGELVPPDGLTTDDEEAITAAFAQDPSLDAVAHQYGPPPEMN